MIQILTDDERAAIIEQSAAKVKPIPYFDAMCDLVDRIRAADPAVASNYDAARVAKPLTDALTAPGVSRAAIVKAFNEYLDKIGDQVIEVQTCGF